MGLDGCSVQDSDSGAGWYVDDITVYACETDIDADGVVNSADNCALNHNPAQRDTNGAGFGNICDADLSNDCIVNVIDLGVLKSVFFSADADADLNGDGVVNVIDLGLFKSLFFQAPGPSGLATCP